MRIGTCRGRGFAARVGIAVVLASLAGAPAEPASPGQAALDRGTKLYKQGRYEEATAAFLEATRLDPGLLEAWENLGWARHRAGRHDEAIETWRTVLKVDPGRVRLLNEIGAIQIGLGRWEDAAGTFARSLARSPDQPRIRRRLAASWENAGRLGEAEAVYREVLRRDPADLASTLRLQEFLERHGQGDDALKMLRAALPRLPRYGHILELRIARLEAARGDRAYRRGEHGAALEAYDEAVRADPRNAQYLINLGWARRQLGQVGEAAAAWKKALRLDPGRSSLYRTIADAAREQGDLREAATLYGRAWAEEERSPAVPYRLAEIALEEARIDDAVLWLEELFTLPGADLDWSGRTAALFARLEQPDAGIGFLRRRLEGSRAPRETRAALASLHALRGSAAYQAADLETAGRELEEALRLDPESAPALRDLGWVHLSREDWEACADAWTRYAAAYPDETRPQNLLTHLHLKRKDYAAAVDSARTSLSKDSNQPGQRLTLARALYQAGRFTESRALAEALAREQPDDLGPQVLWGELLMQYHDFARGRHQWQKVLDLGLRTAKSEYYWVKSLYELGEYDEALAEARQLLDAEGPKQALLQFLADDAAARDEPHQAIPWYRTMVRHFPDRLAAWLELARLEQQSGDFEATRQTLEEAARHHPGRLEVALARARLEQRAGRVGEAHAAFLALGERHPGQRDVFQGRLETALEAGRPGEALAVLRAASPGLLKRYETRLQESRILLAMGRGGDAERPLSAVIDPRAGTVHVPILLYHGLGDHPRSGSMPVDRFEAQMRALHEEGWTSLTVPELARMLDRGEPFPPRSILITFDDARIDSFELADPVLARYRLRATMFVPTARILDGHPFFADWPRIGAFVATGRWDVQSHGHRAHDLITVDGQSQTGSFLVNREWREEEGRLESFEEYVARLDGDYRQSVRELAARFPGTELVGYAFPFSEAGHQGVGNEPRAAETNDELLARHFRFGLVQDSSGYNELAGSAPVRLLRRFSVPRTFDGEALLRHLAEEHPRAVALAQRARLRYWRGRPGGSREDFERLVAEHPRLRGEAAYYLAAILHEQGRDDVARRHLRTAERLRPEQLVADSTLAEKIRWSNRTRLFPRVDLARDSDGRERLWQGAELEAGSLGPLGLSFGLGRLSLREEGVGSLEGPELSASARLGPFGPWTLEGRAWQRRLDGADDTFSFRAAVSLANDWLDLRLRGGREDIDTLRARRPGIQSENWAARAALRPSPRTLLALDAGYGRFDDGNERRDLAAQLVIQPRGLGGLGFGAAGGWNDTLFQSEAYYSPEDVRWGRALLSYRHGWGAGWRLEGEVGMGLATDALRGRRRTLHGSARAVQVWGEHVRTLFEGRYGSSPGYEGWGVEGSLQLGF